MQVKLINTGSVTLVEIPSSAIKRANLKEGQSLNITETNGILVLSPEERSLPPLAPGYVNDGASLTMEALIQYAQLKKSLKFNDNIAIIVMYLSEVKMSDFNSMKENNVISNGYKCFSDLATNINEFVSTRKESGKKTIISTAILTDKGVNLVKRLNEINSSLNNLNTKDVDPYQSKLTSHKNGTTSGLGKSCL